MPGKRFTENWKDIMRKAQIFCFTFAGGTKSFFDQIEGDLSGIELVKIEYPGHGIRYREPLANNIDDLVTDVMQNIREQYVGGKYGLFGYSMGSIVLVEVLKRIIADLDMPDPAHVFLAAHEPRTKKELLGVTEDRINEWVRERTLRFGGVPDNLVHNKTFWRTYLPLYRADYTIINNYHFEELDLRTGIPATVFYSEIDTPRSEMRKWELFFIGKCEFFCYDGNHFFIHEHHNEMAEVILDAMRQEGDYDIRRDCKDSSFFPG